MPVRPTKFWVTQILTSGLTLVVYVIYAAHQSYRDENKRKRLLDSSVANVSTRHYENKTVWVAYLLTVFIRLTIDLGFLYLQYHFYNFIWIWDPYTKKCSNLVCEHETTCHSAHHPTEKLYFWRYWIILTVLSACLSAIDVVETCCQLCKFHSTNLIFKAKATTVRRPTPYKNNDSLMPTSTPVARIENEQILQSPPRPRPSVFGRNGRNDQVYLRNEGTTLAPASSVKTPRPRQASLNNGYVSA